MRGPAPRKPPRACAWLLAVLALLAPIGATGCGSGAETATPAERALQREDLTVVSRSLQALEGQVGREVAVARSAWPLVANGLPPRASSIPQPTAAVEAAAGAAASIRQPQLFDEAQAASLTGPASQLAGQFRTFDGLSTRGWQLIGAASQQITQGSPAAARFAHRNVALYIDSVYDAHFTLAQIGGQLARAYTRLGGQGAFGAALTQAQVDALKDSYSEATDRLHPHPGVSLGS